MVLTMRNSLDMSGFCKLLKPFTHGASSNPKDLSLLHGVLLGEVRRKHLEELFLDQRMTDFSGSCVLVLRQHLKHHRRMHQQFVTNQNHRLKVILQTDYSLWQRFRDLQSESRENHTYALHSHRHTFEDRIKLIAKSMALRLVHGSEHTGDGFALGVRQIEVATMFRFSHPSITLAELAILLFFRFSLQR